MGSVEITSEVIAFRRSEVQDRRMPPDGLDRALVEMVRSAWRADYSSWLDENAGPYVGDRLPGCAVSNSQVEWTKRDMLRTSLKAVLDCNLAMLETDFRAELTDVTVPTLIIQGDHDASIPLELSGKRTVELIPGARLKVYENAPHGLYLTHRYQLNSDLLDFIKG
jgi:non-heme chloroperoxidase